MGLSMSIKSFSIVDTRSKSAVFTLNAQKQSYTTPHQIIGEEFIKGICIFPIDQEDFKGRARICPPANGNKIEFELFAKAVRYFYENTLPHGIYKLIDN